MNSLSTLPFTGRFLPAESDGGDYYSSWRRQVWWLLTCWATKENGSDKALSDIVAAGEYAAGCTDWATLGVIRPPNGTERSTTGNMADARAGTTRTDGPINGCQNPWGPNDYQYLSPVEKGLF